MAARAPRQESNRNGSCSPARGRVCSPRPPTCRATRRSRATARTGGSGHAAALPAAPPPCGRRRRRACSPRGPVSPRLSSALSGTALEDELAPLVSHCTHPISSGGGGGGGGGGNAARLPGASCPSHPPVSRHHIGARHGGCSAWRLAGSTSSSSAAVQVRRHQVTRGSGATRGRCLTRRVDDGVAQGVLLAADEKLAREDRLAVSWSDRAALDRRKSLCLRPCVQFLPECGRGVLQLAKCPAVVARNPALGAVLQHDEHGFARLVSASHLALDRREIAADPHEDVAAGRCHSKV